MSKEKLLVIHKYLVISLALIHLILIPVHIDSLILLIEQISGFAMFMFILLGLVCLFNATRTKDTDKRTVIKSCVCLSLTIFSGIWIGYLYLSRATTATGIDVTDIWIAFVMCIGICFVYLSGIITLVLAKLVK